MMSRLHDLKVNEGRGLCLMVMYQSFSDCVAVPVKNDVYGGNPVVKGCGGNPACPVVQEKKFIFVQACCGPNNLIMRPSRYNSDFNIIEITEKEDFRSVSGRSIAYESLRGPNGTLFFTALCTRGSSWTAINRFMGGAKTNSNIDAHVVLF